MTARPSSQPDAAAFTRHLLRKHRANTLAALEECRELRLMGEFGRAWYVQVEHALELRAVLEAQLWRY